jgi:hypothetical protein
MYRETLRLWPSQPNRTVFEVDGKGGEPTFVVSFEVPNYNNFERVHELAVALRQDAIAAQYQDIALTGDMCGPASQKYGMFEQELFTTEEEAKMMSHPKAEAARQDAAIQDELRQLRETVARHADRIQAQADQILHLESRTAELKIRADAAASLIRTGWMAGAGSTKPVDPEPEVTSPTQGFKVDSPKPEPKPTDTVQVTLPRHVAEKIGRLLYCHISGVNSIDMGADFFAKALGVPTSSFRRFEDAKPNEFYKDGHVLNLG